VKEIDVHITEQTASQEAYNVKIMLRVFDKLDEIVKWINKHEVPNNR